MVYKLGGVKISGARVPVYHFSTYGMYLFFILLPFEYPLQTIGVGSILRYIGMLAMVLAAVDLLRPRQKMRLDYRVILIVIWCIYAAISGLWCADKTNFSKYISMYVNNSLMFLMISLVPYTQRERQFIEKGFIGGVVLLLLYMTFVPGAVVYSSWQSRLTLAYQGQELLDQNYLAAIMVMPYGFLLYDLINNKQRRITNAVICAAILYYILRTGSRGGLLAVAAITVFCLFRGAKKKALIVYGVIFFLVIVGPWVISLLPNDLLDRFSIDAMMGNTSESGGRLKIWAIAWDAIKSGNVLFGYGAGASEYIIGLRYAYEAAIHNFIIAHILELGLIGLALFGTMIIKMIRQLMAHHQERVWIAFLGILVVSIFLDVLTTKFFWGALMMLTVYISASKNAPEKNEDDVS